MITQNCISYISGVGSYLPSNRVFSEEIMRDAGASSVGINPRFLEKSTGIMERRFADPSLSYAEMAANAAHNAILDSGVNPLDIDVVLFCGIDNDYPEPSTAHEVQRMVGAKNAVCLDISNACLGLLNGLSSADQFIATSTAEVVLVCTGERPSDVSRDIVRQLKESRTKEKFRRLMGAFTVGDSGGAFIVTKSGPGPQCKVMRFHTDSEMLNLCFYRRTSTHIEFEMEMEALGKVMSSGHKQLMADTYSMLGWQPGNVGKLYAHQVGARPHRRISAMANVDISHAPKTYDLLGNLTSATFAVNYDLNRPAPGEKILFLGAGSGCSICQIGMQ